MIGKITYQDVIARLEENDLEYFDFNLQNDTRIIITRRGGRIFGPFPSTDDSSILWMNPAFQDREDFKKFLASGNWNLGGDRIWIAPEIQFGVRDRQDYWNTLKVPEMVDPGNYRLTMENECKCLLSQQMTLEAYNIASGQKELSLGRTVQKADNPLRSLCSYNKLMEDVVFAGFEQTLFLSEGKNDGIMAEAWNLSQLNPGGILIISSIPCAEYIDYYEPIDDSLRMKTGNHVCLKITGNRRYKVGYKATHVFGRLAYYNCLNGDRATLFIRNFLNNPSSVYTEEPPENAGNNGYSVHVYNDGGAFGGFGELECNAQTIGGSTGKSSSVDQMLSWFYAGAPDKIKTIAFNLMGIML